MYKRKQIMKVKARGGRKEVEREIRGKTLVKEKIKNKGGGGGRKRGKR